MERLNREFHSLLLKLAKRNDASFSTWFNCSLTPNKNDPWSCYVCQKEFAFKERILEIDEHGFQHLKDSNLLPFI